MGKDSSVVVGYRYFVGIHMIGCHGPVDRLNRLIVGDRVAWSGEIYEYQSTTGTNPYTGMTYTYSEWVLTGNSPVTENKSIYINKPELFGGDKREGGVQGIVDIMLGAGDQPRNVYLQSKLGNENIPAFRNLFSIVLNQTMVSGVNPYIKPWKPDVTRFPNPGWYSAKRSIGNLDANPVHIVVECLTNADWGLGYSLSDIDTVAFQAAADTLYAEGFGLSILWDKQTKVEEFIQSILQHIDAALYVDPATGLFTLRLIRNDVIAASLPLFTNDEIISVDNFSRAVAADLPNTLTVRYIDRNGQNDAVTVHDIGGIESIGQTVAATIDMPGIPTRELALKVAMRELGQVARPLAKMTVNMTRAASGIRIGDAIRVTCPEYRINQQVFRVMAVGYGTLRDGMVRLELVEDAFSLPPTTYTPGQDGLWTSPYTEPAVAANRVLIEAPWWVIVREITGESATAQAEIDLDGGVLMVGAAGLSSDTSGYQVYTRQGSAPYSVEASGYPTPSGILMSAVTVTAISFPLNTLDRLDRAQELFLSRGVTWAILDSGTANEEIVGVDSINVQTGVITVRRGVLDTVSHPHAAGTRVYFLDAGRALSQKQYLSGETVDAKILTATSLGILSLDAAPSNATTFTARAMRPYPPGNLKFNGVAYPATIAGELTVSWSHRNRLSQTAYLVAQSEGNIGPEPGTTYTLKLYGQDGLLKKTETGLTGTSYTWSTEIADTSGSSANIALLEFDGANNSTTFTDGAGILTWSANGDAKISTASPKIGTGSLVLDGSGDWISAASNAAMNLGTSDFTIEGWINPSALTNNYATIFGNGPASFSSPSRFLIAYGSATPDASLRSKIGFGGYLLTADNVVVLSTTTLSIGTWYHVAVTRSGNTFKLYINGVLEATATNTASFDFSSGGTRIGANGWDGTAGQFAGKIDQLRVRSNCAYTGNFTPPTDPVSLIAGLNSSVRAVLTSVVGGRESHQAHDWTVTRA